MLTKVSIFLILSSCQIIAQTKISLQNNIRQEVPAHGLFNTDRSTVNCNLITDNSNNSLLNSQTPILMKDLLAVYQLNSFNPPITYDFVRSDKTAYAIFTGACDKNYRGSEKPLVLIGENIVNGRQSILKQKLILAAILAHEIAHFKQQALKIELEDKEVELHADFMAGWYLAQYVSRLNLERDKKLQAVITALSTFYLLGQDEKPSVLYGTPENRLQISLDGYQEKATDVNLVYYKGINLIKKNSIYRNLPNEVGTKIRDDLKNITGQEESLTVFNVNCPGRTLISDNTALERIFSCRITAPNNLGSSQNYQTIDELFNALNKGVLSSLPPDTIKIPGSQDTNFNVADLTYPIRQISISKESKEIFFGITFNIPFGKFQQKNTEKSKKSDTEKIENQIFELAKKSRSLDISTISLLGTSCSVDLKLDGNRLILCSYPISDFENKKEILFSIIPKGFHYFSSVYDLVAWNNEGADFKGVEFYSKRQYLHSPINFIAIRKPDDRFPHILGVNEGKLVISVVSDATIGKIVTEKREMDATALDFDQKISTMSKSEKQIPSFSFGDTPCDVDEVDDYSWGVECQIIPDAQKNETIDSIFTQIRNSVASWSPIGWEEDESEITYNLRQPEQITESPMASDFTVSKSKSFVQLRFYVNENNSKVKFGSNDPNPNKLGKELLNQIKTLTNIDVDTTASFQVFGEDCLISYFAEGTGNHIECRWLESKVENQKKFDQLKEAVISILPKNWKYRIGEKEFAANQIGNSVCPDKNESQKLMCPVMQIYSGIKENGAMYFNIDFNNDKTKLNKP